jgi:hypothetical protein
MTLSGCTTSASASAAACVGKVRRGRAAAEATDTAGAAGAAAPEEEEVGHSKPSAATMGTRRAWIAEVMASTSTDVMRPTPAPASAPS